MKCSRLYLENVDFCGIERLTGISNVTVMRWIKRLGEDIEQFRPDVQEDAVSVMELDEMWHFIPITIHITNPL